MIGISSSTTDVSITFTAAAGTYTFVLSKGSQLGHGFGRGREPGCLFIQWLRSRCLPGFERKLPVWSRQYFHAAHRPLLSVFRAPAIFYYMPRIFVAITAIDSIRSQARWQFIVRDRIHRPSNDNDLGLSAWLLIPVGNGWLLAGDETNLFHKFANGINPPRSRW